MASKAYARDRHPPVQRRRLLPGQPLEEDVHLKEKTSETDVFQQGRINPVLLSPGRMSYLQRTIGNQAVQRLIPRQVTVSTDISPGLVVQRQGTYDPLSIDQAGNINAIEEQEYGQGTTVAFTSITSCIGFLARVGKNVFGLHMGVIDAKSKKVEDVDKKELAKAVGDVFPKADCIFEVGMSGNWDGETYKAITGAVYAGFDFNSKDSDADLNDSGNIYKGVVEKGVLVVYKNDKKIFTEDTD